MPWLGKILHLFQLENMHGMNGRLIDDIGWDKPSQQPRSEGC
jgi:hypothetical protein